MKRNLYVYMGKKLLVRTKTLAIFFGVTPKTIIFWGKNGMKKASRGLWSPADVFNWLQAQGRKLKRYQDRLKYKTRATKLKLRLNYFLLID